MNHMYYIISEVDTLRFVVCIPLVMCGRAGISRPGFNLHRKSLDPEVIFLCVALTLCFVILEVIFIP